MKHTPTPWKIQREQNHSLHIFSEVDSDSLVVATCFSDPIDDLTKANAELIVKAVNNFDDLSKFVKMVNECLKDGIPIEQNDPIHEVAKRLDANLL